MIHHLQVSSAGGAFIAVPEGSSADLRLLVSRPVDVGPQLVVRPRFARRDGLHLLKGLFALPEKAGKRRFPRRARPGQDDASPSHRLSLHDFLLLRRGGAAISETASPFRRLVSRHADGLADRVDPPLAGQADAGAVGVGLMCAPGVLTPYSARVSDRWAAPVI
jgi:hypothetical protein